MYEALLEVEKVATFNIKPQVCFERAISAINSVRKRTQPYFFIQDLSGIGKPFLYSILCNYYCT